MRDEVEMDQGLMSEAGSARSHDRAGMSRRSAASRRPTHASAVPQPPVNRLGNATRFDWRHEKRSGRSLFAVYFGAWTLLCVQRQGIAHS
jgi:hypothetical protein